MKKSDLRTGMTVKTPTGYGKVLLNTKNGDIIAGNGGLTSWFPLNNCTQDFKDKDTGEIRILAVYAMESNMFGASITTKGRILWEKPAISMTLSQVKEQLGFDFNLIEEES